MYRMYTVTYAGVMYRMYTVTYAGVMYRMYTVLRRGDVQNVHCDLCRARKLEQAERRCEGFSAENFETQIENDKLARWVIMYCYPNIS